MTSKEWIGVFLVFLLVAVAYLFWMPLHKNEYTRVRGILDAPVEFGTHGGDFNHHYAAIIIRDNATEFKITDCQYAALQIEAAKQLLPGDSVDLLVLDEFSLPQNDFQVFNIRSPRVGLILDINRISGCYSRQGHGALYLSGVVVLILLIKLIVWLRRKYY